MEKELEIKQNGNGELLIKDRDGSWNEYKIYIIKTIDEIKTTTKEHADCISKMQSSIKLLNFKAGLFGILGGGILILLNYFKNEIFK